MRVGGVRCSGYRKALCAILVVVSPLFSLAVLRAADGPQDVMDFLRRIRSAWNERDLNTYLALWEFPDEATAVLERTDVAQHFAGEESTIEIQNPRFLGHGDPRLHAQAEIFTIKEPYASAEQMIFRLRRRSHGWVIEDRATISQFEGLVHLDLDPAGYRADGLSLTLPDFELQMRRGTLFTPSAAVGMTALAFVGEGWVRFTPYPRSEQEQLRQFCGKDTLDVRVKRAFIRLNPVDFNRILKTAGPLAPDPRAAKRYRDARRMFDAWAYQTYVLDSSIPRSPWWAIPGSGSAIVVFNSKLGDLTFAVSDQPEGLTLFKRDKQMQICLYPKAGMPEHYSEDEDASFDILHHDIHVRFDLDREHLEGTDTIRLRALSSSPVLRLKLDGALDVESISSEEWGAHLFFRVRNQSSLLVALGSLVHHAGDFELTVRYSGRLPPSEVREDVLFQLGSEIERQLAGQAPITYANQPYWFPQRDTSDYATGRLVFDVPKDHLAVTGGERTRIETLEQRTVVEYQQPQPSRYFSVTVGRLRDPEILDDAVPTIMGFGAGVSSGELHSILSRSRSIVTYYQGLFGPFPYTHLNVVYMESVMPGGHSPPGMTVLSKRSLRLKRVLHEDPGDFSDFSDFFLAHELAHQWWGHGVAPENYRERWLSEALAHYAAAMWVRHASGEREFKRVLERMGWWARRMTDKGPIRLGYRLGHIKGDPQIFRAIVYDKGAYVLHMLSGVVGDDVFLKALRRLQETARFQKIGTDDLRHALETEAQKDLEKYFKEWVYGTALPRLFLSSQHTKRDSEHVTTVGIAAQALPGPVPLLITLEIRGREEQRHVTLVPAGGEWTFQTLEAVRKVAINKDQRLLAIVRD